MDVADSEVSRDLGRFTDKLVTADMAYDFRDLVMLPGYTEIEPNEARLETLLSPKVALKTPFISSGMDTVTESEMAIAIGRAGGTGVLHRNCTIDAQEAMATVCRLENVTFGAAVSPFDLERCIRLSKIADFLMMDIAHAHSEKVFKATNNVLKAISCPLVFGTISTKEAACDAIDILYSENLAGFRVGLGSGSICVTSEVTKVGSPAAYAITQVADVIEDASLPFSIVSDGGMKHAGDATLALALGADAVMSGRLFAGCDEAPGARTLDGKMKEYRGMGSFQAMEKRHSADRYAVQKKKVPEGVSGLVPCQGPVSDVMERLISGMQASMGYVGARSVVELWKRAKIAIVTPEDKLNSRGLTVDR